MEQVFPGDQHENVQEGKEVVDDNDIIFVFQLVEVSWRHAAWPPPLLTDGCSTPPRLRTKGVSIRNASLTISAGPLDALAYGFSTEFSFAYVFKFLISITRVS